MVGLRRRSREIKNRKREATSPGSERPRQQSGQEIFGYRYRDYDWFQVFFFQLADEETKTFMEDLMADFQSRPWQELDPYPPVKKGEWVAAKFSVDGNWYRASLLRTIPAAEGGETQYELRYVDYGNTEVVTSECIRKIASDFAKKPAQAHKGKLAYISAPELTADFGDDAAVLFKELVWGKTLLANFQHIEGPRDDSVFYVILGDEETTVTINGELVTQGLASVEPKRKVPGSINDKVYEQLQHQEQSARSSNLRIWVYGALPDSSDEEHLWTSMLK